LIVTIGGVEVLVAVEFGSAAQDEKCWPPKNTPRVCASVRCSVWRMAVATVAFDAQKLIVKLKVLRAPLQIGVTVVPS